MKTLILSPFCPYPPVFGGALRLYNVIRAVRQFSEVDLLGIATWTPDPDASIAHLEDLLDDVVFVSDPESTEPQSRMRSVFSRHSFDRLRYRSPELQPALDQMLRQRGYDVVMTEMTPMAGYDLRAFDGLTILDLQNIEHELVHRRASLAGYGPRRWALELDWRKTRHEELSACRSYDLVFAPSDRECELLRALVPGREFVTIANTIDPDRFPFTPEPAPGHELLFIGATHVDANRDGVVWFAERVLPLIERQVPDVRLTVVGGNPPPVVRELGQRPNVEVTGFVDDLAPLFARAAAQVVPLRTGGGTRLKLLEGLATGLPTVSTTVGAEGIDVEDDVHVVLADDAAQFADRTAALLEDPARRERLARRGRTLVEHRYSWRALVDPLQSTIEAALAEHEAAD